MKTIFTMLIFSMIAIFSCGCDSEKKPEKLMDRDALQTMLDGPECRFSTMWKGMFYCGSKGTEHYLVNQKKLTETKVLSIDQKHLRVDNPFPLTEKQSDFVEISKLGPKDYIDAKKKNVIHVDP